MTTKKVHTYHIFIYAAVFSHLLFCRAIAKGECVITITQYQRTLGTQDVSLFPCVQHKRRVRGDSGHVTRGISSSLPCSSPCMA